MPLLGPPTGYIDLLDEHLAKKNTTESTEKRRYNPLRPSSSGKCAHELGVEYAQFKGLIPTSQEVISPDLTRIFSLGHSIEYNVIRQLEDSRLFNIRYKQQVVRFFQLSDGSWVEGSIDMAVFFNGHGGCGDVKSKKDRLSGFHATGWDEFNEGLAGMKSVEKVTDRLFWIDNLDAFLDELKDPWLGHNFYQLNMYCNSQFIKESGIDHGFVYQYNKNDSRLRELRFRPSETVYKETQAKFNWVHDTVLNGGDLKELECPPSSLCMHCWKSDALAAYYKTLPPKKWAKDTSYLGAGGKEIEALYSDYLEACESADVALTFESAIIKKLEELNESKVKLPNGHVIEAKFLKTPKPHFELRRGK